MSPRRQATQESRNCGNNRRYQVAIIRDGEEDNQCDCDTTTQEEVSKLVPSSGVASVVFPNAIVLHIVDDPGDVLRGDFLKNWIEHRRSELRDRTEGTKHFLLLFFRNIGEKFLWDRDAWFGVLPIARLA